MSKNDASQMLGEIQVRHWVVLGFLVLGMMFLLFRALQLQVLDNGRLQAEGRARQLGAIAVKPVRGRILDRRGEVLAISTPVDSIWADPNILKPTESELKDLTEALGLLPGQIEKLLQRYSDKKFVYLRRHLPPDATRNVLSLNLPGVYTQREYRRYYPSGLSAGHILGFTNIDDQGQEGVEKAFDKHLSGVEGKKRVLRDAKRRIIQDVNSVKPVYHGRDLVLSIDLRLQAIAHRYLTEAVHTNNAAGGSALLLDAKTSEVLAMVNLPDFNPNDRSDINNGNFRNRAITDVFEPGSTVKPFTMSLALASGSFTPDSMVETSPGYYRIGGWTIHDIKDYGNLSLSRVLIKSSNIGTAKIAMEMTPHELHKTFFDIGFGQITGVELPGEQSGILPNRSRWRASEHASLAYGYGVAVTSLQLARAYAILASNGVMLPISIRRQQETPRGHKVIPEDVVVDINKMLEQVVSPEGTAQLASIPAFRVAGKTGTVRKLSSEGGYAVDSYQALFAGFAPASDPRFVLVVLIDEPSVNRYYGGEVAAPVFSKIMTDALRLRGVPGDRDANTNQIVFSNLGSDMDA